MPRTPRGDGDGNNSESSSPRGNRRMRDGGDEEKGESGSGGASPPSPPGCLDCTDGLLGTSAETNRVVLYGVSSVLFGVSVYIMSEAVHTLKSDLIFSEDVYSSWRGLGNAIIVMCLATMAVAISIIFGVKYRRKQCAKSFLVAFLIVFLIEFVLVGFVWSAQHEDNLSVVAKNEFRQGWKFLVEQAIAEPPNDKTIPATSILDEVERDGSCCGYDSITDVQQNPPELGCDDDYTQVCKAYFEDYVRGKIKSIFKVYLATIIVSVLLLLLSFVFACKLERRKQIASDESPGVWLTVKD